MSSNELEVGTIKSKLQLLSYQFIFKIIEIDLNLLQVTWAFVQAGQTTNSQPLPHPCNCWCLATPSRPNQMPPCPGLPARWPKHGWCGWVMRATRGNVTNVGRKHSLVFCTNKCRWTIMCCNLSGFSLWSRDISIDSSKMINISLGFLNFN